MNFFKMLTSVKSFVSLINIQDDTWHRKCSFEFVMLECGFSLFSRKTKGVQTLGVTCLYKKEFWIFRILTRHLWVKHTLVSCSFAKTIYDQLSSLGLNFNWLLTENGNLILNILHLINNWSSIIDMWGVVTGIS